VILGAGVGWFIGDFVYAKRHNRQLEELSGARRAAAHFHLGPPPRAEMPDDPAAMKSAAPAATWPR